MQWQCCNLFLVSTYLIVCGQDRFRSCLSRLMSLEHCKQSDCPLPHACVYHLLYCNESIPQLVKFFHIYFSRCIHTTTNQQRTIIINDILFLVRRFVDFALIEFLGFGGKIWARHFSSCSCRQIVSPASGSATRETDGNSLKQGPVNAVAGPKQAIRNTGVFLSFPCNARCRGGRWKSSYHRGSNVLLRKIE